MIDDALGREDSKKSFRPVNKVKQFSICQGVYPNELPVIQSLIKNIEVHHVLLYLVHTTFYIYNKLDMQIF